MEQVLAGSTLQTCAMGGDVVIMFACRTMLDRVDVALDVRGLFVEQGRIAARDRNEWRRIVSV